MTQFTYIKYVNLDQLKKEFISLNISNFIEKIEVQGNIVKINTTRSLSESEKNVLYKAITSHTVISNMEKAVQQKVTAAMQFGQQFMIEFATENIMLGFTTEQILRMLLKYGHIQSMMLSGSLYTALEAIEKIPADDLISQSRKDKYIKKIKGFLGL